MDPQTLFHEVCSQGFASIEQKDDYNTWVMRGGFTATTQIPTPHGDTITVAVVRLNLTSFKALFTHEGLEWKASFPYRQETE